MRRDVQAIEVFRTYGLILPWHARTITSDGKFTGDVSVIAWTRKGAIRKCKKSYYREWEQIPL